jgi:hypothetical protein
MTFGPGLEDGWDCTAAAAKMLQVSLLFGGRGLCLRICETVVADRFVVFEQRASLQECSTCYLPPLSGVSCGLCCHHCEDLW